MRAPAQVRRRALLLLLATLGAGAWASLREGPPPARFRIERLWSWSGTGEVRRLAVGRRAQRQGAVVVALAGARVHVLDARGKELRSGGLSPGARFDAQDVDGDGDDEIAVTEWVEQPPLQLYDERLSALGPNVQMLEMGLPAALGLFDLDGDGRRELLLSDFRGCVAALRYPTFLWDHCLTPGGGPAGDPYAVRHMALVRGLSGARLLVATRESGEMRALDARGQEAWRYEAGATGLVDLLALDSDGDGADELALCTRGHGVLLLDAAGRRVARLGIADYSPACARIEWDGDARTAEVVMAHDGARLSLFGRGGFAAREIGHEQILHLAAADLDGDGRDELLLSRVSDRLELLARREGVLASVASLDASGDVQLLERFEVAGRPAFLVAVGEKLHALSATFVRAGAVYSARVAALAGALLVVLASAAVMSLRPPLPREDQAARG